MLVAGADGEKSQFPNGLQTDHLSENTVGHGVSVPGRTSGVAIETGYVGQIIYGSGANVSLAVSGTVYNVASLTLTPGVWLVFSSIECDAGGAAFTLFGGKISEDSAAMGDITFAVRDLSTNVANGRFLTVPTRSFNTAVNKTLYLVAQAAWSGGTAPLANWGLSSFYAVRIA